MDLSTRKRHAIHSGIGDNDDLLVKKPQQETATQSFQYAARLHGKKKHQSIIYPEIPFEYGIHYEGKLLEVDNEKPYAVNVLAHPQKTIAYEIEETKEFPIRRLWEAEALFEAEVRRYNLRYAVNWLGKKSVSKQSEAEYAVNWKAAVTSKNISDAKDFFTSENGQFIGYGDATTWKKDTSGYVYDYSNIGRFSGIIAKDYYNLSSYEAEFDFKTVLATNDAFVGGNDDDIVGIIFKAKDNQNFYMMLWEREERVKGSWRAPDNLEDFNMLTSGESKWENRIITDGCKSSSSMTTTQFDNYKKYKGWRLKHRRIYKVTNGVMERVDTTPDSGTLGFDSSVKDLGGGTGWSLNTLQGMKIASYGNRTQIFIKHSTSWFKAFELTTDWSEGSFGTVNVSQSVQFHRIEVREKTEISGRIPETGWDKTTLNEKNLGRGVDYCLPQAKSKAQELQLSDPNIDPNSVYFTSIHGKIRDATKGSITEKVGQTEDIIVKALSYNDQETVGGRVPATGWYEFDGFGEYVRAQNASEFIKSKDPTSALDNVTITSIVGEVEEAVAGTVVVESLEGKVIAKNNNAADAGKIYNARYVECGVAEITPDYRSENNCFTVFNDIASVFIDSYNEFFNRPDYINKKQTYNLLQPEEKEKPKPPETPDPETSEAGCYIEDPVVRPPEEEEKEVIEECWTDFYFDGKKLCMWGCEFPTEITKKLFEEKIFAYEGWKTLNPLSKFDSNEWSWYHLMPIEATINPEYTEIKWANNVPMEKAPKGSKIKLRTKEWYKGRYLEEVAATGIITNELDIELPLPACPEQFFHPVRKKERMPDDSEVVHFLLDVWKNHSDVVFWFKDSPLIHSGNVLKTIENQAKIGKKGMPILKTDNDNESIIVHCKENPREVPWVSGKYIGYGKVNGKRPFHSEGSGKADMINTPTDVVFFPDNVIRDTIRGPLIDLYDEGYDVPRIEYLLHSEGTLIDFSSNYREYYTWYTDWHSDWLEDTAIYEISSHEKKKIISELQLDPSLLSTHYDSTSVIIEDIDVISTNPFVEVRVDDHNLDYYIWSLVNQLDSSLWFSIHAHFKKATPLSWNPMIHNGYYYHQENENYLFADKIVHQTTPVNHEVILSPRPQQGSAIIVRDNEGNNLRKVTFYDEDWNLTLENKEVMHGNGYAKYYFNYKGIDKNTLFVSLNDVTLSEDDYFFHEEESAIEFMKPLSSDDTFEVRYKLLYSYFLDMNHREVDYLVEEDVAKIILHSNYDLEKMMNMEIIYEGAIETPFYQTKTAVFNPLLTHNHTGFLYVTDQAEQIVKEVQLNVSDQTLSNSGIEKVTVTGRVIDQYHNPCPNKQVTIYRDKVLIYEGATNEDGEVYVYDTPTPTVKLVSEYRMECEGNTKTSLLNYYIDQQSERYYLDIQAHKLAIMSGVADETTIRVTLRDHQWNPVGVGHSVQINYQNTHGDLVAHTLTTNEFGEIQATISGEFEAHGTMMIKFSYNMGFEYTTNYVHIKVIGG